VTPSRAVLFDFDGTFADTAPDLAAAINRLRLERGLKELPVNDIRPYASMGARGLVRVGFGLTPEDADYPALRDEFLARYDERVCVDTRLFPGMMELLGELKRRGIAWGIVTNKATRFTGRIVEFLEVDPGCVVCGDTTPHIKPHPAPLLRAAELLKVPPAACWYVGDDPRDIQAARAAGMRAVAVEYGYHGANGEAPRSWNADITISMPLELIQHL
jgi:phosphoglycolate phosphatase